MADWIKKCYSRLLIDNHITDQKPEYMASFDPANYVAMVKLSGVKSSMVYACDHNGNCYYPTKCGHMHTGLKGRDIFGETIRGLAAAGIVPIAYYTMIYHNDGARRFPGAHCISADGTDHGGRYHQLCANAPETLAFHEAQIAEVLRYPEIQGIFLDMTFWPRVCTCPHCQAKYRALTGKDIPETIDWDAPEWVTFQRFRQDSMAEFAAQITAFIRAKRPDITVTHQFSPVLHGWRLGQSAGIAKASDYASGDFYGGPLQQRLGTKVFDAFCNRRPYEFMTSRCVSLYDHTSSKSADELKMMALTTLANGGAYFFIDAINPAGTLNRKVYETFGEINRAVTPYRNAVRDLDGALTAKVAIYFSMDSQVTRDFNGIPLKKFGECGGNMSFVENPVRDEIFGTSRCLNRLHLPYRIVTDTTTDYTGLSAILVNNAAYLAPDEVARLRKFVQQGGTLLLTGLTSLYDRFGHTTGDFALADVSGVHFSGKFTGPASYLQTAEDMVFSHTAEPLANAAPDAEVLGRVNLTDFPPNDPEHYASIHSNPPGYTSGFAALTRHAFGKGQCYWLYSSILGNAFQAWGEQFLKGLLPAFDCGSANLHPTTELTLLKSSGGRRLLLCAVNGQPELPPVPLIDVRLKVRLPEDFVPTAVQDIGTGKRLAFSFADHLFSLSIPRIDFIAMLALEE